MLNRLPLSSMLVMVTGDLQSMLFRRKCRAFRGEDADHDLLVDDPAMALVDLEGEIAVAAAAAGDGSLGTGMASMFAIVAIAVEASRAALLLVVESAQE
jgi:hypothetical protein